MSHFKLLAIALLFGALLAYPMSASAGGSFGPLTILLNPEDTSGQTGLAVLTDIGDGKTRVEINVQGEAPGALEPAHIHFGQCGPTLGDVAFQLNLVIDGKSTTEVETTLQALLNGKYAINGHHSSEEMAPPYVFCGNIPGPGTPTAPAPTSVPPTSAPAPATATSAPASPTTVSVAPTSVPVPPTAPPPAPTIVFSGQPVTISITAEDNSGQDGTAVLTDLGSGKTRVEINVQGEAPGALEPAHIHFGQCGPTLGDVAFQLNLVIDGKSTTDVDTPLQVLLDGQHAINGHHSSEEMAPPYVFCGNIPAAAGVVASAQPTQPPTQAPATGAPSPTPLPVTGGNPSNFLIPLIALGFLAIGLGLFLGGVRR